MLKSILKTGAVSLLALTLAGLPTQLSAQSTNKAPAQTKAATDKKDKKPAAHPFRGKLAAVDKTAKTIKLGQSTYLVTSETIILKNGKPATLEDGVVGEEVSGYAKPTADGKMAATKVTFGLKPDTKAPTKKSDNATK
jgi:hypothetical protein